MDTLSLYNNEAKDVILVLDTSIQENLEEIKQNTIEFTNQVLLNTDNRMALITYDEESIIKSSLTSDKETILNEVNNLSSQKKMRSYYQAQLNIENILKEYQEETKEVEVLFLISGYPNADLPNHENYYKYLKSKYPEVKIKGIQYEMGDSILSPVTRISEEQYISDQSNLSNVLLTASGLTEQYEKMEVVEEINDEYFNIIKATPQEGEARVENNKVIWNLDKLYTGKKGKLTIDLEIKEEQEKNSNLITVSKKQEVTYKIGTTEETVSSTLTPKLYMTYQVSYKGNEPEGCTIENLPSSERKWAYEILEANNNPTCNGYQFLGWKATNEEVEEISKTQFRMPEKDIELVGEWGKVTINKSMDGEVQPESTTIKGESILQIMQDNELPEEYYTFEIEGTEEKYPVHIIHYEENQEWLNKQEASEDGTIPQEVMTFGNEEDVSDGNEYAKKMVIVKVNGDLTIGNNVLVQPYYTQYGGPKGFLLYVTGKLTNNGTIDNSHGAYAEGQDVYLWHNTDGTYEYVPKEGASGAPDSTSATGNSGSLGTGRQTGGGGSGGAYGKAGSLGTSYSGGTGGGAGSGGTAGSINGGLGGLGTGGRDSYQNRNYYGSSGVGNPSGSTGDYGVRSNNGTGGLLTIYAEVYENNGVISANGTTARSYSSYSYGGGSSGGGSINIFANQNMVTSQANATISTNTRYQEIKGSTFEFGGSSIGTSSKGGSGGEGTVSIGKIIDGQYYDLTDAIDIDRETYKERVAIKGESLLKIVESNDLNNGYYYFSVTGKHEETDEEGNSKQVESKEIYPVHFINYDGNQEWMENQTFGDEHDIGTASDYAQNMVIVKVNGDLTIGENVLVQPYYTEYGGPKGFLLYVTGKLTNNGTIDNSHGAYAEGQDVYLWKNVDGTYEYVPKDGASGAPNSTSSQGINGITGTGRQTGGGGSGSQSGKAGSAGTSYSGGTGGGAGGAGTAGSPNGGLGGTGHGHRDGYQNKNYTGSPGVGNPSGGLGTYGVASPNGTGGLLTIYADYYENNGIISASGTTATAAVDGGGSSGGGSINIFTNRDTVTNQANATLSTSTRYEEVKGNTSGLGGYASGTSYKGGAGGAGAVSIGKIIDGQYYDLTDAIDKDRESYIEGRSIKGDSILKILQENDLKQEYYYFSVTGKHEEKDEEGNSNQVESKEIYPVHFINYEGNQEWLNKQETNEDGSVPQEIITFGDEKDVGTSLDFAQNMVIVKVNGDLTIGENVTVGPYYDENYGGPKGLLLYVTGKLTNNGTIDNSHGAYAEGQDVYLWKNADGTYEYVPKEGAVGAENSSGIGNTGIAGTGRQTGGGGSGAASGKAGGPGTSYSGGPGGGAGSGGTAGSSNGGTGGFGTGGRDGYQNRNYYGSSGVGNPSGEAGSYGVRSNHGTGGLLTIYANDYENNGMITANGTTAKSYSNYSYGGGSSGGGSINIFTNRNTITKNDDLSTLSNIKKEEIKGNTFEFGGSSIGTSSKGGAGGQGTVSIGKIIDGQYYDLVDAIEKDKMKFIMNVEPDKIVEGESILQILSNNNLKTGYYYFSIKDEFYPVHLINYDESQEWIENQTFGDSTDVGSENKEAYNMVIVKVNGDLTIGDGVTISPIAGYGGPKGFLLYVTGKLTNNGTISSTGKGAYAEGENVYLWKNVDGTYEYVPAKGATGGLGTSTSSDVGINGNSGTNGENRQTGGGGSGGNTYSSYSSSATIGGAGSSGTSYSGGAGGGSSNHGWKTDNNANALGTVGGNCYGVNSGNLCQTGVGVTTGIISGYGAKQTNLGTGGLLIIYANDLINEGIIESNGVSPAAVNDRAYTYGGASGGGSVNIFYKTLTNNGNVTASGGIGRRGYTAIARRTNTSGNGGNGSITYTQIDVGTPSTQSIEKSLTPTPEIKLDNTNWSTSKEISITYPTGDYINQYSIDLGTTWNIYTSPITLSEPTTVLSRSIDSSGNVVSSSSFKVTSIDNIEPEITLELPEEITVGEEYLLPTSYKVGNSGGKPICKVEENTITNTKELISGSYTIACTIENGLGVSKNINNAIAHFSTIT